MAATDRSGFRRRYGVHVFRAPRAPFVSLGVHLDWHTPTLDLHFGRMQVQVGKNNWEGEGRFSYLSTPSDGHTDQCTDWLARQGYTVHVGRCRDWLDLDDFARG